MYSLKSSRAEHVKVRNDSAEQALNVERAAAYFSRTRDNGLGPVHT
jgi:hypothetical protein